MKKATNIIRKNTMLIILVLVFLFFTITTGGMMFTSLQFNALITQNSYVYILATGMLMCMLTGGNIDLAWGAFVCFVGAVGAKCMVTDGMSTPVAILIMLGIGIVYGCILGFLIAYLNIPPWIATLAGYLAFRGWGTALLGNATIGGIPDGFLNLFNGTVPDIFGVEGFNVTCFAAGIIV